MSDNKARRPLLVLSDERQRRIDLISNRRFLSLADERREIRPSSRNLINQHHVRHIKPRIAVIFRNNGSRKTYL
jgi:hypothetical protein